MLNMEVKGNLARLLATENLIVEHRQVETAMFNVKDRVLTLPMWDVASQNVYDMLVGHEVGHALYTPDKWGTDFGVPQSYLNVCEDARIEKLMKRKFPGLARNFYTAYQELHSKDFFEIGTRSMDSYALIDRINLYFKIGVHASMIIPFNSEEKELVDLVGNAENFDEVVYAAQRILQYTKQSQDQQKVEANITLSNTPQGGAGSNDVEVGDGNSDTADIEDNNRVNGNGNSSEGIGDDNSSLESDQGNTARGGGVQNLESETDKAFAEKQKQLSSNRYNSDLYYVELPPLDVNTFVVFNKQVMDDCKADFSVQAQSLFENADSAYSKFRSESQREVNYLVKEFEMRKSADQYARASTAKTGILDTQKLHTYKWNEDVFKKINVVPDGKNHGLIFILDWSGSMSGCLQDTAKQLLNLAWFCKKVQIPFDIYAFTNDYWNSRHMDYESMTYEKSHNHHAEVPGYVQLYKNFRLLNMVSSNGRNGKDLEEQLKNFWRLVWGQSNGGYYVPTGYGLSGTPLNEAVISLTAIIPDFQKRNKVQKTNVVILTDGESQSINYYTEYNYGGYRRVGYGHIDNNCILRDRKTGRVYPRFEGGYYNNSDKITKVFLQCVRDRYPDVNLIGIRLVNGRGLHNTYACDQCKTSYSEIQKQWKKNKSAELIDFLGYQSLYLMALDSLSANAEFDVDEDASSKEIGNAFKKALAKKGVNKKMLTSFASLIS